MICKCIIFILYLYQLYTKLHNYFSINIYLKRLLQDIGFGNHCGFQTLLVFSGGTSEAEMLKHNIPNEIPNYCANDLSDFTKIYNEINN